MEQSAQGMAHSVKCMEHGAERKSHGVIHNVANFSIVGWALPTKNRQIQLFTKALRSQLSERMTEKYYLNLA
jgi:hypothetical protein